MSTHHIDTNVSFTAKKHLLLQRISIDPEILAGKPIIRGMRISVEQIINLLSEGMSSKEIIDEFPILEEDDIRAALVYAHEMLLDECVYPVESNS